MTKEHEGHEETIHKVILSLRVPRDFVVYSINSEIFAFSTKKIQPLMNANSREFLYSRPLASIRGLNIFGCGLSALGIVQV